MLASWPRVLTYVCLPLVTYNWQSEGRCSGNCTTAGFALAILQNFECWCSNTVPARSDQKSTDNCNTPCPGYPTDWCGGSDTYAYIALGKTPSSTAQGDDKAPQTTVSVSKQTRTSVSEQTTTHVCTVVMLPSICLYSFLPTCLPLLHLHVRGPSL